MLTLSRTQSAGKTLSPFQRSQFCRCWFCCWRAVPGALLCSLAGTRCLLPPAHFPGTCSPQLFLGLFPVSRALPGACSAQAGAAWRQGWIDTPVSPPQVSARFVCTNSSVQEVRQRCCLSFFALQRKSKVTICLLPCHGILGDMIKRRDGTRGRNSVTIEKRTFAGDQLENKPPWQFKCNLMQL